MKKIISLCVIMLVAIFLNCSSADEAKGKKSARLEVSVGAEFAITLEANRSTGYEWKIVNTINWNVVELIGKKYIPDEGKALGLPGKEVWTFKAVKPGKITLHFQSFRPWEKVKPDEKKRKFVIIVRT